MEPCKHEFGTKSRGNELYCPVCRGTVTKDDFDSMSREGTRWWESDGRNAILADDTILKNIVSSVIIIKKM
jgi:hypothetical protein